MKKILGLCLVAFGLAACNPQEVNLIKTQLQVVQIPEEYYARCKELKAFPSASTLTDKQVADVILTLYKNNRACKQTLDGIKEYLLNAETTLKRNG